MKRKRIVFIILVLLAVLANYSPKGDTSNPHDRFNDPVKITEKHIVVSEEEIITLSFYDDQGVIVEIVRTPKEINIKTNNEIAVIITKLSDRDNRDLLELKDKLINIDDISFKESNNQPTNNQSTNNIGRTPLWKDGSTFELTGRCDVIEASVKATGQFIYNNVTPHGLGVKEGGNHFLRIFYEGTPTSSRDHIRIYETYIFNSPSKSISFPEGDGWIRNYRRIQWSTKGYSLLDQEGRVLRVAKAYTRAEGAVTARNIIAYPFSITYATGAEFYIKNQMRPLGVVEKTTLLNEM